MKTIIQKDLTRRWGKSLSTVRRYIRKFSKRIKPVALTGLEPVYRVSDVDTIWERAQVENSKALEKCRKSARKGRGK